MASTPINLPARAIHIGKTADGREVFVNPVWYQTFCEAVVKRLGGPANYTISDLASLTFTDGAILVGNGTGLVLESGAVARASLGLGTIATQSASNVTITGGSISGITNLALADGGTGASLTDPGADRILFWDYSAGVMKFLTVGTGLTITDTTLTASGGGGGGAGVNYDPDLAPASPSAYDDEFDDDSIDAAWTSFGTPDTLTESSSHRGFLKIEDNDGADCGVYKTFSPGANAFTVVAKFHYNFVATLSFAGIVLLTSGDSAICTATLQRNDANAWCRMRTGPAGGTNTSLVSNRSGTIYIRITRDAATNYIVSVSWGGLTWETAHSFSQAGTVDRLRLLVNGQGSSNTTTYFDFVRTFTAQTELIGNVP